MDGHGTGKRVLLGCTGSVASLKLPLLESGLREAGCEVRVIVTDHARHFIPPTPPVEVMTDADEWAVWTDRGDPVLHVELGKWGDLLLIAPLDANSLAKLALGLCDNLVTCTVRAWDMSKPVLFCPAMNTRMYQHPITEQHINTLKSWGYREVPAISKTLVCGDVGLGAMAEVSDIIQAVMVCFPAL